MIALNFYLALVHPYHFGRPTLLLLSLQLVIIIVSSPLPPPISSHSFVHTLFLFHLSISEAKTHDCCFFALLLPEVYHITSHHIIFVGIENEHTKLHKHSFKHNTHDYIYQFNISRITATGEKFISEISIITITPH